MGVQTVTVYGTVMEARLVDGRIVHRVEATAPGGTHLDLIVVARSRRRGSVRVIWDPEGILAPRFAFEMPWGLVGVMAGIVAVIVLVGWFIFT